MPGAIKLDHLQSIKPLEIKSHNRAQCRKTKPTKTIHTNPIAAEFKAELLKWFNAEKFYFVIITQHFESGVIFSHQPPQALLTAANWAASLAVEDCQCDLSACSSQSTPDGARSIINNVIKIIKYSDIQGDTSAW